MKTIHFVICIYVYTDLLESARIVNCSQLESQHAYCYLVY